MLKNNKDEVKRMNSVRGVDEHPKQVRAKKGSDRQANRGTDRQNKIPGRIFFDEDNSLNTAGTLNTTYDNGYLEDPFKVY
jgi:hypothetical protein